MLARHRNIRPEAVLIRFASWNSCEVELFRAYLPRKHVPLKKECLYSLRFWLECPPAAAAETGHFANCSCPWPNEGYEGLDAPGIRSSVLSQSE
ncbi:hypothetical protein MPTK1_3g21800 [Marchantia polymorpha subsp. ruderalis]|uniref:Uncharacterized protein n=2 Tax=Marchantia polymorpha TaxID=3197 RepID=A0AAF6B3D0_MARPO|nr:hypothetical protein MARPO_0089s0036 [Marchantia polymorpha]BBN06514.1 hypothetical protein Mp_3g21800 [Marchantia polymorpha subsp. ruderalis]|eukprot:PTQ33404.1 hypothetical protein MARPO_0089s0036 [Marchantia polymorpha]